MSHKNSFLLHLNKPDTRITTFISTQQLIIIDELFLRLDRLHEVYFCIGYVLKNDYTNFKNIILNQMNGVIPYLN